MLNKLLTLVRRYEMICPGDTVICAVSGGADSVALLFALYLLREKLEIRLEAAHYNHHLRGAESDRDEAFVCALCQRFDIPLHLGGGCVSAGNKGLEAAAREARYGFFDTLFGKIATAHTADDNAETLLMHMVRGTGLKGLGGISPVRGSLIRPMLLVTREQVLAFLAEYHMDYVSDSSNDSDAFLRNRLRHHVMPLLRQENPRIGENLSAMALRLREDEEALSQNVDADAGLDVAELRKMPKAVRSRAIESFLKSCGVREPESAHIAQMQALAFSDHPSAWAAFPGNVRIGRVYGRLVRQRPVDALAQVTLVCPGVTELAQLGLRVYCGPAENIRNGADCFTVSLKGEPLLRGRQPGDAIRMPGGTKTLKKLFIDSKIPAAERGLVPVLADSEGILGVYGFGVNRDRAADALPAVQIRFETINSDNK